MTSKTKVEIENNVMPYHFIPKNQLPPDVPTSNLKGQVITHTTALIGKDGKKRGFKQYLLVKEIIEDTIEGITAEVEELRFVRLVSKKDV